jgi:hypothetical protein
MSRDMTIVRCPISAALTPVAAATLVLPTPPFPAKKMILMVSSVCECTPQVNEASRIHRRGSSWLEGFNQAVHALSCMNQMDPREPCLHQGLADFIIRVGSPTLRPNQHVHGEDRPVSGAGPIGIKARKTLAKSSVFCSWLF